MNKKTKILFTQSTNHIAGGEVNLISLLNTIDTDRFEVCLLCNPYLKIKSHIKSNRIQIIPFKFPEYKKEKIFSILGACLGFVFLILRFKIDIVYFNTVSDMKFSGYLLKMLRVPCIAHLHIVEDDVSLKWINLKLAQRILFPSASTMNTVLSGSSWINKTRCHFVHNAVDISVYSPKDTSGLRKELALENNLPVVGIVGQVKHIKGQHLFLKMVKNLKEKGINANYLIVGDDNVEKGKYMRFLKDEAEKIGIKNDVKFPGYRKDIP
ncbi:glycosyltransferase, partial [bacterium]|nr:glycosyltransferase [bacterium]